MKNYEVSIIVPVYNREEIIKPCIESINTQTYDRSKWEVIFVDDASTDNSIKTIESLIDKDINCRVIRRVIGSGNASAPRNEGIKASSSKYVFFLDSDDCIDSELLENGMAIAKKNDSDIVYVKIKGIGRTNTPERPFKNKFVDNADVFKNHLLRSLNPLKFMRLDLIKDNSILFFQSIDKGEDQVFGVHILTKARNISIIADKDYYFAFGHEGEHLSQKDVSMHSFYQTIYIPLNYIYMMRDDQDYDNKKKIYNAWLLKSVERIRGFTKKIKLNDYEFNSMFQLASTLFNIRKDLFDLSQIYENEKLLTLLFLSGDFKEFHRIANESKVLISLKQVLQKKLKTEPGFSKVWVFKNTTAVLDFTIQDNKIAFDLKVDEKKKLLKVWMFSRNNPDSLGFLREEVVKVDKNKLLIFDGALNNQNQAIDIINSYLGKIKAL